MELEVNKRGNLFVPSSRIGPMLLSAAITAAMFYVSGWLNGVDVLEELPSPLAAAVFVVLGVLTAHLILSIQAVVEFDSVSRQVVKGRKVIVPYDQIRQIEIRRGHGEETLFTILLRLGISRSYVVLYTNDETSASLDAAAIARVVGKEVRLVD